MFRADEVLDFGKTAWRVIDLDPDDVVSAARASLIRDFTPDECQTYGIERCDPTVADG